MILEKESDGFEFVYYFLDYFVPHLRDSDDFVRLVVHETREHCCLLPESDP